MNFRSTLVLIFVLASFGSLPHFNNASFVATSCRKAAALDQEISRDFCMTSLQAEENSGSPVLTDLICATLNLAIKNTTSMISQMKTLLSNSTYANTKKGLSCCQDGYSRAVNFLYEAINQITKKPSSKYIVEARNAIYRAQDMSVACWNACDIDNETLYDQFFAKDEGNAKQLYLIALVFLDKDAFKI